MLAALTIVGIAALIVAATFFWLGRRDAQVAGAPELIRADPAPYKIRPDDPGGLDVAGESETAYSTSAGEDPDAALDMAKLPEGVEAPAPEPVVAEAPKKAPPKEAKAPAPVEAAPVAGGPTIQLGAYASTIKAETAWSMLSARFPEVAALNKSVVSATVGGKAIHRLRAVGIVRADPRGVRGDEGGGRKLPGRQLMQAAIYGLAGCETQRRGGRLFPRHQAVRLHLVPPQHRGPRAIAAADQLAARAGRA